MKEQQDITKLEFLMTVNDNFIVQRFFNVKGYNAYSKSSVELLDLMEGFVDKLKRNFKMLTMKFFFQI
jgi:hypothetical protein